MTITLYRGDLTMIESFEMSKASKHSLVGQGIYLTNNEQVATSYRVKGSDKPAEDQNLWQGLASDRPEAYRLAYMAYVGARLGIKYPYIRENAKNRTPTETAILAGIDRFAEEYQHSIADGLIRAEYVSYRNRGGETSKREMVVHYFRKASVGHLSKFRFSAREFNTSMFMIDGRIADAFFWELVWDNNIDAGLRLSDDTKEVFVDRNRWRAEGISNYAHNKSTGVLTNVFVSYKDRRATRRRLNNSSEFMRYLALAKMLRPYGYRGFEYRGGVVTGSNIRHRAFSVWDDEWVNEHRVS